ncbi:MAG: NAD-dependent epimerase/dehydratase family protein, partial [bacterium]
MTSRRELLKVVAAAGPAFNLGRPSSARAVSTGTIGRASRSLRILILGGTGFTGPYQVRYAVARGHHVTVFNRGRRQVDLPDSVEHLRGDRDIGDLKSLQGKPWDVVVDNPTTLPFWVRAAAAVLKGHVSQYVFISTISVYADVSKAGMDEDTPLLKYTGRDAMAETAESIRGRSQLYGQLKAISEATAQQSFPGRTTVIRPGLIVGPGDDTDRFTYWPARLDRGGEILAPGEPN